MTILDSNSVSTNILKGRIIKAALIIGVVFIGLVLRLGFLQIVKGWEYRTKSENNRIRLQDIPAFRGMIFDRSGNMLVDSRPSFDLFVVPEDVRDEEQLVKQLHDLIGLDPRFVRKRLENRKGTRPFKPICLKRQISRKEVAIIETHAFNLPGVLLHVKPRRHYEYGDFAAHVLGYLGEITCNQLKSGKFPGRRPGDLVGKLGIEQRWEELLCGEPGGEQVEVDAEGRKLRVISRKSPTPGANVYLTIDKDIQALSEKALHNKRGAIVALNPNNGEILALASSPDFDPNMFVTGIDDGTWKDILSSKDHPLQNRAVAGQYPPGSIFKIVVGLAALEEGAVTPEEEIFCKGSYRLGKDVYRCWSEKGHGKVAFHRAFVQSCDVYFYELGNRLGVDKIAHYANMLGLGEPTGLGLGNEKGGLIPTRKWKREKCGRHWQPGETLTTAIGQGYVLVTPIQMANLIAAVFNGGGLYRPQLTRRVVEPDKEIAYESSPRLVGQLKTDQGNMETLKEALIGVVNEQGGTGHRAGLKEVTVAGKTGTAQVVSMKFLQERGLSGKNQELPLRFRDHAWFVGVAPAEDPVIAVSVLLEHGGHGGVSAAPIAKEIIGGYLGKVSDHGTPRAHGLSSE